MIVEDAKRVIRIEADALYAMADRINGEFSRAVETIMAAKGRVIVCGMGKSGLVGQKIASTMASTGTPAFFLHPAEAIHGDLGMIMKGDVVIAISNSGETEEVLRILPVIKRLGAHLIGMSGRCDSTLARCSDVFLDVTVKEEACPLGLAPTASTTATLAMGDALAVALLIRKGFKAEDFAMFHPGGALGKKLFLRVEDLMHSGDDIPLVNESEPMKDVLYVISAKRLGVAGVTDAAGQLKGVITDGDLRRALEKGYDFLERRAGEIMKLGPRRIGRRELAAAALQVMEQNAITSLFVFDSEQDPVPCGIVHLHDILRAGIA
ncbi:MAG TPA: KpsF/GutQ family sugar-phosphate isomerase [Deltaproteobacteria bacterium]|nr:KpsF/GutQ family sugar-phosphate isomerase [Deltaproteobacteria bacterium]HQB39718.1 KpsF/GutQ family sugar-phosphate isomerase [Deltaproteobacteria bacterium]